MRNGRVVGFLKPDGFGLAAVVSVNGKESLVAKEAASGNFYLLNKGEAFKLDSCSSTPELANKVREVTGIALGATSVVLESINLLRPDGSAVTKVSTKVASAPKAKAIKTTTGIFSLSQLKRKFGTEAVNLAIRQTKGKKRFDAIPLEYKASVKAAL